MPKKKTTKKKTIAKKKKPTPKPAPEVKKARYLEAIGRRKTSVARVRIFKERGREFLINGKTLETYFSTFELQQMATAALREMDCLDKFRVSVKVRGGGIYSQSEAVRHGTARALVLSEPDFRKKLKKLGFLTRDPRMRERKKFGLKRARRAPQWKKR